MIDGIEVAFEVAFDGPGGSPTPHVGAKSRLTASFWSKPLRTVSKDTFINRFQEQFDLCHRYFSFSWQRKSHLPLSSDRGNVGEEAVNCPVHFRHLMLWERYGQLPAHLHW